MVEVEDRGREHATAATARPAEVSDCARFRLATRYDNISVVIAAFDQMPHTMAVRADKITLRGFGQEPREGSTEVAEAEVLRRRIAMMELEGLDRT